MEVINEYHFIAAALIARVFLGCLFLFQGYDAVFRVKIYNIIETFEVNFSNRSVPRFLITIASWFTSYTELVCGFLLIIGLFEYVALFLLGINLIIAAIGFGINTPVWDTRYVYPRLILLLFLLCIPHAWNCLSLDYLFFKP